MSASTVTETNIRRQGSRPIYVVTDALAMAARNLKRLLRAPDQVVFTLVSPIMFMLLFRYVFGGAIRGLQGINYLNYLIPGIAVQTAIFAAGTTGFALADDLQKGFIDRLRSLPMARSAVLAGRVARRLAQQRWSACHHRGGVGLAGRLPARQRARPDLRLPAAAAVRPVDLVHLRPGRPVASARVEAVNAATFPVIFPLTFASQRVRARPRPCPTGCGPSPTTSR